jgi:purine nucleosidase
MSRHRIIIDTDPGVDDAAAILLALASPEIDVLGISVVGGNVPLPATTANACKIVALSGRRDVPVYAGAPGPLVREQVFGKYAHIGAFSDELVPATGLKPEAEHAVDFIVRVARDAAATDNPITICAIGPLTNIALALVRHPDVARGIKQIVAMGGAFTALGHRTPWAEFNIYADSKRFSPRNISTRSKRPGALRARPLRTCWWPSTAAMSDASAGRVDRSMMRQQSRGFWSPVFLKVARPPLAFK